MQKIGIPALGLFGVWLLLSGHYTTLLVTLGAVSALGTCLFSRRLGVLTPGGFLFAFLARVVTYLPWLIKEIVVSNLAVARIVWSPRMPIRPQVIRVPSSQRTGLGLATFANSITLTPGTLSLDADEPHVIVVHALADWAAEGLADGEMDRRVTALEGST